MFVNLFSNIKADKKINVIEIFNNCIDCYCGSNIPADFDKHTYKYCMKILDIPKNRESFLSEFILLAYMKSAIEYDISTNCTYNNSELQNIVDTVDLRCKSNILNHLKMLITSYSQIFVNMDYEYKYNFLTNFFNFLNDNNILTSAATGFAYSLPVTILPFLICIINAWDCSPILSIRQSSFSEKEIKKRCFCKFKKKVNKRYSESFELDETCNLFMEYLLHLFFDNTYIYTFIKDSHKQNYYEYQTSEASFLRNEWIEYDKTLCIINQHMPFLSVKKILAVKANEIYKSNMPYFRSSKTGYTDKITKIEKSTANFMKHLRKETDTMIENIQDLTASRLPKKNAKNNCFIQTETESYVEILEEKLSHYILNINTLKDNYYIFINYFVNYDHSTFETIFDGTEPSISLKSYVLYQLNPDGNSYNAEPYKYLINYEFFYKIESFCRHISEYLKDSEDEHKERLKKYYSGNKRIDAAATLHRDLKKIDNFITTLEKYLIKNPPVQEYISPKQKEEYAPLAGSIKTMTDICEDLFCLFYDALKNTSNQNESIPLWHTLHLCIADHIETFKESLCL